MSTRLPPESAPSSKPPLALIAGPTASGKTDCAVRLALAIAQRGGKAAVINCDSAQVYRDLKILSARPDDSEMHGVDHLLFGTWDGATACSTADWAKQASTLVARLHSEGTVPILAGGTGLYMRTLLEGISPIPPIDPAIREEIRAYAQPQARAALEQEDPEAAARLAPADVARTARALEVIRSTGHPIAHWHGRNSGGIGDAVDLTAIVLTPDREALYARCDLRFERMVERGAIAEVEALLARDLNPELPVMRAIGVREIARWLSGDSTREQAIAEGQLATRQYAKRQFTWFRNQPPDGWHRTSPETCDVERYFERILHK